MSTFWVDYWYTTYSVVPRALWFIYKGKTYHMLSRCLGNRYSPFYEVAVVAHGRNNLIAVVPVDAVDVDGSEVDASIIDRLTS